MTDTQYIVESWSEQQQRWFHETEYNYDLTAKLTAETLPVRLVQLRERQPQLIFQGVKLVTTREVLP